MARKNQTGNQFGTTGPNRYAGSANTGSSYRADEETSSELADTDTEYGSDYAGSARGRNYSRYASDTEFGSEYAGTASRPGQTGTQTTGRVGQTGQKTTGGTQTPGNVGQTQKQNNRPNTTPSK